MLSKKCLYIDAGATKEKAFGSRKILFNVNNLNVCLKFPDFIINLYCMSKSFGRPWIVFKNMNSEKFASILEDFSFYSLEDQFG